MKRCHQDRGALSSTHPHYRQYTDDIRPRDRQYTNQLFGRRRDMCPQNEHVRTAYALISHGTVHSHRHVRGIVLACCLFTVRMQHSADTVCRGRRAHDLGLDGILTLPAQSLPDDGCPGVVGPVHRRHVDRAHFRRVRRDDAYVGSALGSAPGLWLRVAVPRYRRASSKPRARSE